MLFHCRNSDNNASLFWGASSAWFVNDIQFQNAISAIDNILLCIRSSVRNWIQILKHNKVLSLKMRTTYKLLCHPEMNLYFIYHFAAVQEESLIDWIIYCANWQGAIRILYNTQSCSTTKLAHWKPLSSNWG